MKIAVWHNLPSGGGKRSLYHHVRGLVEKGHTVESWCPDTADQTYLPLGDLITEHIVPFHWQPRPTKTSLGRVLNPFYNITDKIKLMDEHCKHCAEEINAGDFDVLFANPCTFFRVTSIGQYVKIPNILYLQEPYRWLYEAMPDPTWAALPSRKSSRLSLRYSKDFLLDFAKIQGLRIQVREEWQNAKAFDTILVNSSFSRESVARAYGLDSKVCYLGIDTDLFKPLDLPRDSMVIGLGAIYPGKGLERAVQAIGTIKAIERPSLVWVGNFSDSSYLREIEELASSLGVNFFPKVRISDQEIITLLNQASVMVYTPILEPFGFAPLEANACETPVVAIAEGGVRETIQDGVNGFLINGYDPIEIGEAISKLMTNTSLVREMGKIARKLVLERWSLDSAINNLEDALLSVAKSANTSQLVRL